MITVKYIDRHVTMFIRDECNKLTEASRKVTPDLKAIAIDGSREDTIQVGFLQRLACHETDAIVQLLKLILLAALYSPVSNQRMVQTMTELPGEAANHIAGMISSLEHLDRVLVEEAQMNGGSDVESVMSPERSGTPNLSGVRRDPELEREEQLIKAFATIKERERKIASLTAEVTDKTERISQMQDELSQTRNTLEQGGLSGANNEILAQLRERSARDTDYIAELESQVGEHKEEAEDRQRQLTRLKGDADSKQKLRDELQLLRVERDDLVQKSKASENLKKKIQTLQEADKSNSSLRSDLEDTQEELRALKHFKNQCTALQKRQEELLKTISNQEQEMFDRKTYMQRLEHDRKAGAQRHELAKERQARDAETISELEERLRQLEDGQSSRTSSSDNLDDELTSGDEVQKDLRSRLAALEVENAKLKDEHVTVDDDAVSRQEYDLLKSRYSDLEQKYLETYTENLGLEAALKDPQNLASASAPFVEMRRRLHEETSRRTEADKRVFEAEGERADALAKFEISKSKLAAIDADRTASLAALQSGTTASTDILESEKERLAIHGKSVEFQLETHKDLLRHSLLNRDILLKEDEELRGSNEFRLISHELNDFKNVASPSGSQSDEAFALSLAQRIEDGRKKVKDTEEIAAQVKSSPHHNAITRTQQPAVSSKNNNTASTQCWWLNAD